MWKSKCSGRRLGRLVWRSSPREAGRLQGLEQQAGGREGVSSEIAGVTEATEHSWPAFRPSQGSFREGEGLLLTGVLTGPFCPKGGRGAGPAWGHPAAGALGPEPAGQGSWGEQSAARVGQAPGQSLPCGPAGGRCGRGLNPALRGGGGAVGARNGPPQAVLVWEQHLVFGEGPPQSLVAKTVDGRPRCPGGPRGPRGRSSLCCLSAARRPPWASFRSPRFLAEEEIVPIPKRCSENKTSKERA